MFSKGSFHCFPFLTSQREREKKTRHQFCNLACNHTWCLQICRGPSKLLYNLYPRCSTKAESVMLQMKWTELQSWRFSSAGAETCDAKQMAFIFSRASLKCANTCLHSPSVVKGKLASGGRDEGRWEMERRRVGKEGRRWKMRCSGGWWEEIGDEKQRRGEGRDVKRYICGTAASSMTDAGRRENVQLTKVTLE